MCRGHHLPRLFSLIWDLSIKQRCWGQAQAMELCWGHHLLASSPPSRLSALNRGCGDKFGSWACAGDVMFPMWALSAELGPWGQGWVTRTCLQLCRSSQPLPTLMSLLLAPSRYPSPLPGRRSPGMHQRLVGDTWPTWGRKPSPSSSTVPATCRPRERARCHGHTSLCEYPASTKGDNGDRGDAAKGFRICHPFINSLQAPRRGETSLVATRTSVTSVGRSVQREEPGLLIEVGKAGDRVLWLAGA